MWSYEPYIALTTNTSDTSRFAEPAGNRRTDAHWQLDFNYTQNLRLSQRLNLQLTADFFNVNNRQTGYNYPAERARSDVQHAAGLLRSAAVPAGGATAVLAAGDRAVTDTVTRTAKLTRLTKKHTDQACSS